jgi:regulator of nucleoside diphosphate kinase
MKPNIIVTTVDFDRLEALIDSMPHVAPASTELLEELQRAEIVEPRELPSSVVTMHSTVRFTIGAEKEFCRTLVYPREVVTPSTLSVLSPVGSALLGLSVGSSIEWPGPLGDPLVIRIVDVVQPPESA